GGRSFPHPDVLPALAYFPPTFRLSRRRVSPATWFSHLHLAAGAQIVRAVFQSIRRLESCPHLSLAERLTGLMSCRDLLLHAVAKGDLFSWYEDHLPDRHAV